MQKHSLNLDSVQQFITNFYIPAPKSVIWKEDLWQSLQNQFGIDDTKKSTAYRYVQQATDLLQWEVKNSMVRKKKRLIGISKKSPQVYFRVEESLSKFRDQLGKIGIELCDKMDTADIICVKKHTFKSKSKCPQFPDIVDAFIKQKPFIEEQWITDSIDMNVLLSYENYRVTVGKLTKPKLDCFEKYHILFHEDNSFQSSTSDWLKKLVSTHGGKVMESFEKSAETTRVVVSSSHLSALGIPDSADHIVHYTWLIDTVFQGTANLSNYHLSLGLHSTTSTNIGTDIDPLAQSYVNNMQNIKSSTSSMWNNQKVERSLFTTDPLQHSTPRRLKPGGINSVKRVEDSNKKQTSHPLHVTSSTYNRESLLMAPSITKSLALNVNVNGEDEINVSKLMFPNDQHSKGTVDAKIVHSNEEINVSSHFNSKHQLDETSLQHSLNCSIDLQQDTSKTHTEINTEQIEQDGNQSYVPCDSISGIFLPYDDCSADLHQDTSKTHSELEQDGNLSYVPCDSVSGTVLLFDDNSVQFNQKLYMLKKWSNETVYKTLKLSDLKDTHSSVSDSVNSFASYLGWVLPDPGTQVTAVRRQIAQCSVSSKNIKLEKLRAFATHLFPPVAVKGSECAISSLCADTYVGDALPQFIVNNNCGKKIEFKCVLCPYSQKQNSKLAGHSMLFEGIHQMYQHGISKQHKHAFNLFASINSKAQHINLNHSKNKEITQMKTSMSTYLGKNAIKIEVPCYHIFDADIVESFKHDQTIHRMTPATLFKFREFSCQEHEDCVEFDKWKSNHHDQFEILKKEKIGQAVYIPTLEKQLQVHGNFVKVNGAIKSVFPTCLGTASSTGKHPYSCINCYRQKDYLKDLMRKRKSAKLRNMDQRCGTQGMRKDYLSKMESELLNHSNDAHTSELVKQNIILRKIVRNSSDWTKLLTSSIEQNDYLKFMLDMADLFRQKVDKTHPIQWLVLQNLVGKLKSGTNHQFNDLVKQIAKKHKNELGATHYATFKEIFGLPSASTVATFDVQEKFYIGCNEHYIEKAALSYENQLVVEGSDEARVRRSLDARLSKDGIVTIIGKCWNPDPKKWPDDMTVPVSKHGVDQFDQLEKQVKEVVQKNELATHVSVHNFNSITERKPTIVYSIWPTPNKGYNAEKLYNVQQHIRRKCSQSEPNIALIGHSTDSAAFSLSLAVNLMTPNDDFIEQGINYLALGIPEEQFMAPYFWKYPTINYLDFEHNQRSSLRQLKYTTLDLILYLSEDCQYKATIDHVNLLRSICMEKDIQIDLSENDLILLKFFDQNSEAAYKVFNLRIADLLDEYVSEARGTALYIRMIYHMMSPFYSGYCGTPADVVESVATGLTMLRLWRRSVMINKRQLISKKGASTDPTKRGNFITNQTFHSLEIQCHAAIQHQLALFLHSNHNGRFWTSPRRASTVATERFIGQTQAKTSHIQSLNTEPSAAEIIDRTTQLQYNFQTEEKLKEHKLKVSSTTSRKRTMLKEQENMQYIDSNYAYPSTYELFQDELKEAFYRGVGKAQSYMETLPGDFKIQLMIKGYWTTPFTFVYSNVQIVTSPPTYDKIDIPLNKVKELDFTLEENENEDSDAKSKTQDQTSVDRNTQSDDGSSILSEDEAEVPCKNFYIHRNGEKVNLHRALKIALGTKDIVRKDRFAKHWASKYLPNYEPIPESHNIILLKHYIVKKKVKHCQVVRIISIQESGKRVKSTETKSSTALIQGIIYDVEGNFEKVSRGPQTKITKWFKAKDILCEVSLINMSDYFVIDTETKEKISKLGYYSNENIADFVDDASESGDENIKLSEGEYMVEQILDMRVDSLTHEYEYLVKWEGYSDQYNEWLPGSAFKEEITFTLKSSRGRDITHIITPGEEGKKRKRKTENQNEPKEFKRQKQRQKSSTSEIITTKKSAGKESEKKKLLLPTYKCETQKRNKFKRIIISDSDSEEESRDIDDDEENIRSTVSPWGGESDGTKLHNTCTIDSVFSCLFLLYRKSETFRNYISQQKDSDTVCEVIHQMFDVIHDGRDPENWTRARKIWLARIVKEEISKDVNVYGSEEELLITHLNDSILGQFFGLKEWNCSVGCSNGKTSIKRLNILQLLERWGENRKLQRCYKRTTDLPLHQILYDACCGNGAEGTCRKCQCPANVQYSVRGWPPLLMLHVYDFIKKFGTFNEPSAIPINLHFTQKEEEIMRYKVLMVTLYRRGHFCGAFFLRGNWWLYDPFSFKEKVRRMESLQKFPGECVINFIFYVKEELR